MTKTKIKGHTCERCHKKIDPFIVFNLPYYKDMKLLDLCEDCYSFIVFNLPYYKDMKLLDLCEDCYSFMIARFDELIEEFILRKG